MKKTKIRLIAAFLVAVISFEMLPVEALAIEWPNIFGENTSDTKEHDEGGLIIEESDPAEEVSVVGELEDQRDPYTKHFRLSNGTVAAVQYETDIHYQDENEQWLPIDNSLEYERSQEPIIASLLSDEETDDVQDTDGYTTKEGKVNFKFAKNANQKNLVRIQQNDYHLSFALKDRNKNKQVDIQKDEGISNDDSLISQMTAPNVYSSVIYRNIQDDVDLQYIASGSDLKENIIINNRRDVYDFTFEVKAKNLSVVQEEDGAISLYDTESNELVYSIPLMYMIDDSGEQSNSISYTLTQKNKKKYELTIHADAEWINAEERQFPVTIDPTLNTSTAGSGLEKINIFNYYSSENGKSNYGGNGFLGYDSAGEHTYRHIVQFKNLPNIPRSAVVVGAQMFYKQTFFDPYNMNKLYIAAKEVDVNEQTHPWGVSQEWGNLPSYSDKVLDYKVLSSSTTGTYVGWDITSLVKKRYGSSSLPSYSSFALVSYDESVYDNTHCAKATIDQTNSKGKFSDGQPVLQITYRDTRGIEDYYTNTTQSIGQAGTAYIGDYSDQLTLIKNDLTNTGSVMDFALSHVYNSAVCYANFTRDANMHTMKYNGMNIGRGWRLSVQETLVKLVIGNTTYYVYSDGDGTEHYFYYDSSKKKYVDEDGLNLTLSFWTNSSTKYVYSTISDKKGNQKIFINGYLGKIQDSYGNQIFITYNGYPYSTDNTKWQPVIEPTSGTIPQNRVTGIVQKNNGKAQFNIASLTYSSDGYLESITDRAGRATTYHYTLESGSIGKDLTTISHPDGTTAEYKYNSSGYLIDAYDAEGRNGVEYTYYVWPVLDVLTVSEYSKDASGQKIYGAKMSIGSGETNRTSFRDYGADGIRENQDDLMTHTMFDNAGRTVCTYTTDYSGNHLYGADTSAYQTNSTSDSSSNNRVTADVATGIHATNILRNGSGESGSDKYADHWQDSTNGTNVSCAVRTDSLKRTGSKGFKVWMGSDATPDSNGILRGRYSQTIKLPAGRTFTFSGYVKTTNCSDINGANRKAYLSIIDSNGKMIAKSKSIDYLTPSSIEDGWERLSVTFTLAEKGTFQVCANSEYFAGISYWDDFQLEENSAASSYNMLDNGSFDNGSWTTGSDGSVEYFYAMDILKENANVKGNGYVVLNGSPTTISQCWKFVPVNQSANNTFVISGWARGNSIPDATNIADRFFGIQATIHYTDNTKETFNIPFNSDITEWQYVSSIIAPKKGYIKESDTYKTISTIAINCVYAKNANSAEFDDICLKKEPVQTYTYDSEGNLTAVNQVGTNPLQSVYEAGTADLKTEEDGTGKYTYVHNKTTHAVESVSNTNIKLGLTYDSFGNVKKTELADTTKSIPRTLTSTAVYSDDGNYMTSQTDTSGITTRYSYNVNKGLVGQSTTTQTVKESGIKANKSVSTNYTYDAQNDRQTSTYIGGKSSVEYTYGQGNLSTIKRGTYAPNSSSKTNQTYSFTYDSFGNKTSVSIGDRVLATYEYAPNNGNLIKTTYGNGNSVELVYDIFDRVVEEKYNGTTKYKYVYNGEGDLAKKIEVDANGKTVNTTGYEYDGLDRLIHSWEERTEGENISEVQRSEHIYDGENRIKKQSWSVGGYNQRSETYTYSSADGTLSNMQTANGQSIDFTYDKLKRLEEISGVTGQAYTYRNIDSARTTTQIADITYKGVRDSLKLSYSYDAGGNIDSIAQNGQTIAEYAYDTQNQLVEENLPTQNVRYEYVYDTGYNIRQVKTYRNGSSTPEVINYEYTDAEWCDLLTKYNGHTITYDAIGNPLNYNNGTAWTFTWQGAHDLATARASGKQLSFHYDMDGVRDSKTVNGVKHEYITQGGNVTLERWNDGEAKSLEFIYDNGGAPYSVIYTHGNTAETYYYILNQQGDVIRIVDANGTTKAAYTYDGWGNILNVSNASSCTIGTLNPIRYRGYYYDAELNMYYLQSRYYDPVVKRMLSADDENLTAGATLNNNNLFSYCDNNPVNRADIDGEIWHIVAGAVIGAATNIALTTVTSLVAGEKPDAYTLFSAGLVGAASGAVGVFSSTKANVLVNAIASGVAEAHSQWKQGSTLKAAVANVAFAAGTAAVSSLSGTAEVRKISAKSPVRGKSKAAKKCFSISKSLKKHSRVAVSSSKKLFNTVKRSAKKHMRKVNWNNYKHNLFHSSFVNTYFFAGPKSFVKRFYKRWKHKKWKLFYN